ncbi:MAG: hypothetical protein A2571_03630 [Candidatus Vogelbacteria bacterium RIFOXYD1_FULL_44_32]|uniref:Uncharacterized protein n=1 Tax=Candidatus Vogelbacteria bacterium RIFOXYD1_FULL_44_32 TaxID=1802438 RepID=A0A1G2QCH1_9BACT|nr:MAG: hypothetical protein A2571_03630 [Candidatus Vogelbacteria bacterium RIFOXYD1_FULL_44_32]
MSNDKNVFETLFRLWGTISKLVVDGKRDPHQVVRCLQLILEDKAWKIEKFVGMQTTFAVKRPGQRDDLVSVTFFQLANPCLTATWEELFDFVSGLNLETHYEYKGDKLRAVLETVCGSKHLLRGYHYIPLPAVDSAKSIDYVDATTNDVRINHMFPIRLSGRIEREDKVMIFTTPDANTLKSFYGV